MCSPVQCSAATPHYKRGNCMHFTQLSHLLLFLLSAEGSESAWLGWDVK